MPKKKKVVLAYSGGLDTSVILRWLIERGYEVIAYCANVGQQEGFAAVKKKALKVGASAVYVEDLRREFVTDYIFPAVRANAVYEGRYLLGTALARPLISKRHVEIARKERASILAHGSTGKGNDQVRFELAYLTLMPGVEVIAPWKDPEFLEAFRGRPDLIRYAQQRGIPLSKRSEQWSIDANLMHTSYEGGELEDPTYVPREDMFRMTVSPRKAPKDPAVLEIGFESGDPVWARRTPGGRRITDPLKIMDFLNREGGRNGVGREDIVENRFVGMKSRGVYETPGGAVLHAAHRDLEGITLDREVMHLRDSLIPRYAEMIYNGFWFSPEREFLQAAFDHCQRHVTGTVTVRLYRGAVSILGRSSPVSLYDAGIASMDIHGGYQQSDAWGFIRCNALRLSTHAMRRGKTK